MNTFLKLLLVIMMITSNAHSQAQVTVTSNFVVTATTVSKISKQAESFNIIDDTPVNDIICGVDQSGQLFNKTFSPMVGSESIETAIQSSAGNYVIVRDYYTDIFGYGYGLYHRNADSDEWTRIRSFKTLANQQLVTVGDDVIIAAGVSPLTKQGNTLVGATYGGERGDTGADFFTAPEYGTLIFRANESGVIMNTKFISHEGAPAAVIAIETSPSGLLVKIRESAVNFSFILLDVATLDQIWASPVYSDIEDASMTEDPATGNWVLSIIDGPFNTATYVYQAGLGELLADNSEYLGASVGNFVSNNLFFSNSQIYGFEKMDLRYAIVTPELSEFTYIPNIYDFDGVSLTARTFVTYTGSASIDGVSLVDVPDGHIGIAFVTMDLSPTGDQLLVNDAGNPNVIDVFNFIERSLDNPLMLEHSENHESYLVFNSEGNIPADGTDMTEYVTLPEGWILTPFQMMSNEEDGKYFIIRGHNGVTEVFYNKVLCTTDDLFVPVTNTPPVILGLTDGVLECGTITSGVNHEVVVNTFDADGESLTLFLGEDAHSEISVINLDSDSHALFFGDVPQGELNFTIFVTDGIDTVSAVASIDVDGQVTITEFAKIQVNVYPNPTTDFVNVFGDFDHIEIYSMAGELVLETSELKIDFSNVSTGTYILRIFSGNESSQVTVVKQ